MNPETLAKTPACESSVEVCFATPRMYYSVRVVVEPGNTIADAVVASDIATLAGVPEWRSLGIGVYGKRRRADDPVTPGDRIELVRKLLADPKLARHRRVQKDRAIKKVLR